MPAFTGRQGHSFSLSALCLHGLSRAAFHEKDQRQFHAQSAGTLQSSTMNRSGAFMTYVLRRYFQFIGYALLASFFVLYAAACSSDQPPAPSPSAVNPMGLSGKYPAEAETNFAMARVMWRNSDRCSAPAKAIEHLDKTIALAPDYAEAYMRRGMAKNDLEDYNGAIDDITQSIRLNATPDMYAYRAVAFMREGNYMGAHKDLEKSIQQDPHQYRAWNYMGALNILEENIPDACASFKKACANGNCDDLESAKQLGYCK